MYLLDIFAFYVKLQVHKQLNPLANFRHYLLNDYLHYYIKYFITFNVTFCLKEYISFLMEPGKGWLSIFF